MAPNKTSTPKPVNTDKKPRIRKLTGKAAKDYQKKLDSMNVYLVMNPISEFIWELHAYILERLGVELRYFDQRQIYTSNSRRLMDLTYIYMMQMNLERGTASYSFFNMLRYRYFRYRYRRELNYKPEYICVTEVDDKNPIFVLREDYDKYVTYYKKRGK